MNNYEYGFITKCAEYGIDPEALIKEASIRDALRLAGRIVTSPKRLRDNLEHRISEKLRQNSCNWKAMFELNKIGKLRKNTLSHEIKDWDAFLNDYYDDLTKKLTNQYLSFSSKSLVAFFMDFWNNKGI